MGFATENEMVAERTASGITAGFVGLIALCVAFSGSDRPAWPERRHEDIGAVAALAWAQSRCDANLALAPGTPRIQAEDLLEAAAELDALETAAGHALACDKAISLAKDVAAGEDAKAGPTRTAFTALN